MPENKKREDRKETIVRLPAFHLSALRLPGDISEYAKEKEIWVPWQKTMMSFKSFMIMLSIGVAAIAVNYYLWPKMKKYYRL
jgi:hypothetical protein